MSPGPLRLETEDRGEVGGASLGLPRKVFSPAVIQVVPQHLLGWSWCGRQLSEGEVLSFLIGVLMSAAHGVDS